jgi:hypothetical protein
MRFAKQAALFTLSGVTAALGYSFVNGNEKLFGGIIMPTIQTLVDPERAHRLAVLASKHGMVPYEHVYNDEHMLVYFDYFPFVFAF